MNISKPDKVSAPTFAELMSNLSVLKYLSDKSSLEHEERVVCGWAKSEIERMRQAVINFAEKLQEDNAKCCGGCEGDAEGIKLALYEAVGIKYGDDFMVSGPPA